MLGTSAQTVGTWWAGWHAPHANRIPTLCDLLECELPDLYVRA